MKRKNTEQAPTPETDAVAFDAFDGQGGEVVFADLARRFERERNKAEAGWLECRNFAQQMVDERDEARRALQSVLDWNPKPTSCAACWTALPARFNADMARARKILEATK